MTNSAEGMTGAGYMVIWEFSVEPEARLAFERAYGQNGDWVQLFRQSPEYRGTQLLRDLERPGRYLTLDLWTSRDALREFKKANESAYQALDRQCERLTERELLVGEFEINDV